MAKRIPESVAENKFCREVKSDGGLVRKMNGLGFRSWHDRWVIPPNGQDFLIEFKAKGEDLSPLQADFHEGMTSRSFPHYTVWRFEEAWAIYQWHCALKNNRRIYGH
jgi:hypothetical protein